MSGHRHDIEVFHLGRLWPLPQLAEDGSISLGRAATNNQVGGVARLQPLQCLLNRARAGGEQGHMLP